MNVECNTVLEGREGEREERKITKGGRERCEEENERKRSRK